MKNEKVLKAIDEHKPLIVNYGKGILSGLDIKEPAVWDDLKNVYTSETGIWSTKLLKEIARGEVEGATIEFEEQNNVIL